MEEESEFITITVRVHRDDAEKYIESLAETQNRNPNRFLFTIIRGQEREQSETSNSSASETNNGSILSTSGANSSGSGSVEGSEPRELDRHMRGLSLQEPAVFEYIAPIAGEETCEECYCSPCIVTPRFRQHWWPEQRSTPHPRNRFHRFPLYRKFVQMIFRRGGFNDDRYVEKKRLMIALSRVDRNKKPVYGQSGTKREIMPDCVIRFTREYYPNPPEMPYVGFRFEWQ